MATPSVPADSAGLPTVDLSLREDDLVPVVKRACLENGFFYLENHGVPIELLDSTMAQQRSLFALSPFQKAAMSADKNNRGYTPFKEETLDPENQSSGDTKEGFYIGREVAPDSEEAEKPLHGPNQWPPEDLLPQYRTVVTDYIKKMTDLAFRMLELLALSLGLEREWFHGKFSSPMIALRPLHYSAELSKLEEGLMAAGAHTDYGMLTLLLTDGQPGLQICHRGEWLDVPPRSGCFVVNLGDMLERWTNGMYKSTLHRVVNLTGKERYSLPFFFEPNFDALVECIPECCEGGVANYPPTSSGEYLLGRYAATHANFQKPGDTKGDHPAV